MLKALLLSLTLAGTALCQNNFYLKSGDRVVFYGDSITDQRLYTTFVETYVVTRFPSLPVTFVHSGWGGDRVTGGGGGPIDVRLDRDVTPYRPTVVTIMLGMNDGSYRAFDPKIFETFSTGYQHIVEKVQKDLPGIRITAIQPSPYDDTTRAPLFEGGYNAVLERYSAFLKDTAAKSHLQIADLNGPVVQMLKNANKINPAEAQKIIPDRIHPGAAGHLVMAEGLLQAWNAPSVVTDVEIDAATGRAIRSEGTDVGTIAKQPTLVWSQTDRALPFPIDWNDRSKLVPLVMESSDFVDALDREMLKVIGLPSGRYILRIDTIEAGTFLAAELAHGINLAKIAGTPMMKQAMEVHALTLRRAGIHNIRWREIQVPLPQESVPSKGAAMAALDKVDDDLMKQQHSAAQPKTHRYEIALQAER